jgi:hypothetical protein
MSVRQFNEFKKKLNEIKKNLPENEGGIINTFGTESHPSGPIFCPAALLHF